MRCEEVSERFAEYLAHSLDAAVVEDVEQHISSCAECQAEFAGIEALWDALGTVPALPTHSNRMRERFSAMLAAERDAVGRGTASRRSRGATWASSFWPGEPLVQMAIAASLLLVGVLVGRALPAPPVETAQQATQIAAVRNELTDMRQMLTLSLMQQQSATERLRGVNWTSQIEQPGSEIVSALLDTLLHDPNVNVRLAAVDALRRFSDRADVRLGARRAVADPSSPLLQVAMIDFMVETRDPDAPALFRTLAADATLDSSVRGRAQWGLEQFAS
jgi:hypothetical protein